MRKKKYEGSVKDRYSGYTNESLVRGLHAIGICIVAVVCLLLLILPLRCHVSCLHVLDTASIAEDGDRKHLLPFNTVAFMLIESRERHTENSIPFFSSKREKALPT